MKNRHFAALVMAAVLLCTACPFASAASNSGGVIAPFWTNTSTVDVTLSFSGTSANCVGSIVGFSGATKITADFVLERKNSNGTYTVVKTFPTKTVNGVSLRFSDTATITTGYSINDGYNFAYYLNDGEYSLSMKTTERSNAANSINISYMDEGYYLKSTTYDLTTSGEIAMTIYDAKTMTVETFENGLRKAPANESTKGELDAINNAN